MKRCLPLTLAILAATLGISRGQSLVDGTNYSGLFGPADDVTVTPHTTPPGGLLLDLSVVLDPTEQVTGPLGDYWTATATGGADGYLTVAFLNVRTNSTGAQVALTGDALEFNIDNDPATLLGALGTGLNVGLGWSATATFDAPGEVLLLSPNSIYELSFDVDGSDGLLNSTLGLTPSFHVEFLDGGNAVGSAGNGSLVNVLGLNLLGIIGSPPGSGRATVQFQTGNTVSGNAAGVRFSASALVPATLLGIGTQFASISNISVVAVPEPSALALGILGAAFGLRRRR